MLTLLLVLGLAAAASAERARFDHYRVQRVVPATDAQVQLLRQLEAGSDALTFWNDVRQVNSSVLIMIPPHKMADFDELALRVGLHHELYISNVQELIDAENPATKSSRFGWTAYHRLEDIYAWLDELEKENPGIVSVIEAGESYQGRVIKGVKVSFKEGNPGVFIEAGIHAREWIAPATATYILNEILTSTDPAVRDIADSHDWYIFPSFNPDGYAYTHNTNRIWRKTRRPSSALCVGADPNRNWGFHWMDGGASSAACSETYAGSAAFSEIETRSMADYITSIRDKIQVYLAFHSYGQMLLIPYGHSNTPPVSNYVQLMEIGTKAVESLANRYGTAYKVGNTVDIIYVASGGSADWVKGTHNTPITYTYELRDTGRYGFLLPASQIVPTGQETLDSVVTILQETRDVL